MAIASASSSLRFLVLLVSSFIEKAIIYNKHVFFEGSTLPDKLEVYVHRNENSSRCCVNYYDDNGVCKECPIGYHGTHCNSKCPENYYGRLCKNPCDCVPGFICQFEIGCVPNSNQTSVLSGGSGKEAKDTRTFGTLELLGTLAIGSLATIIIISLLIFFKKFLERRKTLAGNVDAVVNLLRPHPRPYLHNTPGNLTLNGKSEQGAVGGSAPVPSVIEEASRKSINEYSTIDSFSQYHTMHSLSRLRRSFSSKMFREVRKSHSLTDIDTFEIQCEERQSILHINTRSVEKNIGSCTFSFHKENKPALSYKNDIEKSLIYDDQSSLVKQELPLREKGDEKFETQDDWVINVSNHNPEFGIDIESRECTCPELSSTRENSSEVESNYSKLNSVTRDEHIYGITRQRSLAKSTKKDNKEESQTSGNILAAKTNDVRRERKGKVCLEYHDHALTRSYEKTDCTDEKIRCHDTLSGTEWNNDHTTNEACHQKGNATSTEGNFKDDKQASLYSSFDKKSILTPFSMFESKRFTERQSNANNTSRVCQMLGAEDLEYEYGMNEEIQDSNMEYDDHFRNKNSVSSSTIRPYSFVSKPMEQDVSYEELPSLKLKQNKYPSTGPYSVVTKNNGISILGNSEEDKISEIHENKIYFKDDKNKPL